MSRFPSCALSLLAAAAILTVCAGMAGAVETWVGSDGEIRVVPGTEDPAPPPNWQVEKRHAPAPQPPARIAAPAKPKPVKPLPHPPQHVAAKPTKAKADRLDRRITGAITPNDPKNANKPNSSNTSNNPSDPNNPTPVDKQAMQPIPPAPKPYVPPAVRPQDVPDQHLHDPGNPVITVDPSKDTVQKTDEEEDGSMDPNGDPIAIDPRAPGALPTDPVDPTTSPSTTASNGTQSPNGTTPGTRLGVPPPAIVIDPVTGKPVANPALLLKGTSRLRPALPTAGPVVPVQPQGPTGITSSIAQAPQLATTPNPRSPLDDPLTDPYATAYDQAGIRIGSFIWKPAIELSAGGTTNIQAAAGGTASSALRIAPELIGQSDWSRHQLGVDIHGSLTEFPQDWALYRPTVSATVNGRIDFTEDTRLALKASYGLDKLPSSSSLSASGTTGAGLQQTRTASAGLTRDIGRFALTLRGEVDRTDYQLNQPQPVNTSAAALNNTDLITSLRGTYNLSTGVKPFIEVQADARRYDAPSVATNLALVSHDTTGAAIKSGVTLDMGPLLTGESSMGYGFETPTSHALVPLRAFTIDDSLIWSPTRQTRVTFSTVTAIEPSLTSGASGAVSRTVGVKIADDIFRNLTIDLGGSYLDRHYVGIFRTENLGEVTSGITWKISPTLQTFVRGSLDAFSSSAHTDDYTSASVFAGVRIQR